jgi:pyridoxamine 5'-phosphate oxidase
MLDELYISVWSMLEEGARNRRAPFHLTNVATIGMDMTPQIRTVVLRGVDQSAHTIRFHTDLRSQKIRELRAQPMVQAHFYDQSVNIQLRLSGIARVEDIHSNTARQAFDNAKDMSKVCYRLNLAPGTSIESGDDYHYTAYEKDDVDPGKDHFSTITITATAFEVVVLKLNANRRALFKIGHNCIESSWLVP